MSKKIINIIIFVIAGIACLLALWFAVGFDDSKKDMYYEVGIIKETTPQILDEFQNVTPATLSAFVENQQATATELTNTLREEQLQKDILYTYIVQLRELNETTFSEYRSNFSANSASLFARADNRQAYINGFNSVGDYASLSGYISQLEKEYEVIKQDYLTKQDYSRSLNAFIKRTSDINTTVSENKKSSDLAALQSDVSSMKSEANTLNIAIILCYVVFLLAVGIVLAFSLYQIITNIKTSYKAILAVIAIVAVFLIGYLVASPELSKSAVAENLTPSDVKWIEAGVITTYVLLLGALLSIIITWFINKFKKV